MRLLEFQDENYDGDEDKPILSEESEPKQEESFGPPLLDDMDLEDENKLDAVYLDDVNFRTFTAFRQFYMFRRSADMTIKEFIIKYEALYHTLDVYGVQLPEGVQAFFVLNAANVDEESERLARVTCPQLTYADMRQTILKIFSDPSANTEDEKTPAVKVEPVFKVSHRGSHRGNYRGRGTRGRGYYNPNYKSNATDSEGKVLKCFRCGSTKHFAKHCDKIDDEYGDEKKGKKKTSVYVTLLTNYQKMNKLLRESLGMAVMDTGCSKSLAGEVWLEEYIETLSEDEKKLIETCPSTTSFVFGDGIEVKSEKCVKIC